MSFLNNLRFFLSYFESSVTRSQYHADWAFLDSYFLIIGIFVQALKNNKTTI